MKLIADRIILSVTIGLLVLTACVPLPPLAESARPGVQPSERARSGNLPPAVEYDLGEATILQARFPEESRFRNMPVRLNGIIAAPEEGGPYPVVVIFHGNHVGCPVDDMGMDRWPCAADVEQPNYRGFEYLVRELADRGYVTLSVNINAENTFGFGEPVAGERLEQLVHLSLMALAAASAGGQNDFGVELTGRADLGRLALFGHSRGGEAAFALANSPEMLTASRGYGPAAGALLIAAAATSVDPWSGSAVPVAVILPACDGDVISQDGQFFYEGARLAPQQTAWATSVWLERANHNAFNQLLPGDPFGHQGRPECASLLEPEAQRDWLVAYAFDFLTVLFDRDVAAVAGAVARLGMDPTTPAPGALQGLPGRAAALAPAADRRVLLRPSVAAELATHLLDGDVTTDRVVAHFCPKGFYTPRTLPGSEPCHRNTVTVPGQPSHAVVSWEGQGAALRFALPPGAGDLSDYAAFSLRAAVDPVSPLNPAGEFQPFTVRLTDGRGNHARASTRPDEPALQFPPGQWRDDPAVGGGFFSSPVPLMTVRLPLGAFVGVDLTDIREIALEFDQNRSGSLFLADIEFVGAPQVGD